MSQEPLTSSLKKEISSDLIKHQKVFISVHRLEFYIKVLYKYRVGGFPGGTVVKNPPANAGDTGSIPGPERSHMPRSNWARVPQLLSLRSEKPAHRNEE